MTKTLDELIQRLELIAAWRKRGGDTPSEEMPDTYQACIDAVSALRELIAAAERWRKHEESEAHFQQFTDKRP